MKGFNVDKLSDDKNHVLVGKDKINWSIRGTDFKDGEDVKNDAHIAMSMLLDPGKDKKHLTRVGRNIEFLNKDRLARTANIYKKLRKEHPDKQINIYAHSLGGFLAKDVLHENKKDNKIKVYAINAAPHHSHNLNDERYHSIRNIYDGVSAFESGRYHKNPNAMTYYDYNNPYTSHLLGGWDRNKLDIKNLHQTITHKPIRIKHEGL